MGTLRSRLSLTDTAGHPQPGMARRSTARLGRQPLTGEALARLTVARPGQGNGRQMTADSAELWMAPDRHVAYKCAASSATALTTPLARPRSRIRVGLPAFAFQRFENLM